MFYRSIGLCILLHVFGCDMPGVITVVNESEGDVVFRYSIKVNNDSSKIHTIEIQKEQIPNRTGIMFDIGEIWTKERIIEYVETVNSIEIFSETDSICLKDKSEMYKFFEQR